MVGRVPSRNTEEDILSTDYRHVKRDNVDFRGPREKGPRQWKACFVTWMVVW